MYFITTIEHLPEGEYKNMGDRRCVGYFETFDEADESVLNNNCDIWETIYDYCVVEKIKSGIYQYSFNEKDRLFYKFNMKTRKYDPINTPKEFEGIVGLSIG